MMTQDEFEADPLASGPMLARFFGGFEVTVDGQPIPWVRRMDKRIFRFLLLAPDGKAARKEMLDTFWPGQDEAAALGSLRVACSNIRKAITVGSNPERVDQCFSTTGSAVCVNLDLITVDVRRYLAHISAGNTCYLTTDVQAALVHYKRALMIYSRPIGWGDEPEPWLESLDRECAALRTTAIERIVLFKGNRDIAQTIKYERLLTDRHLRKVNYPDLNAEVSRAV